MSMQTTHANGIPIRHVGVVETTAARRVAAELERAHAVVDYLAPGTGGTVDVWLDIDADVECEGIVAPDGWAVRDVSVVPETDGVCMTLTPEGDR